MFSSKVETKRKNQKIKWKIRKGDKVVVIAGKDKGQEGYVAQVIPSLQKVLLVQENLQDAENPVPLNVVVKHYKAKRQGESSSRFKMPAPIHISNVMFLDPKSKSTTRIGRRKENGKLVRYAKRSGDTIVDMPNIDKD